MARASSLSLAASTTDGALVTAVAGRKIRITSLVVAPGASTTVTLNSKSGGAGTAITPPFTVQANLPPNPDGWFESIVGEGLTITTSAGAASGVTVNYTFVSP
jgi:hypothetical protein